MYRIKLQALFKWIGAYIVYMRLFTGDLVADDHFFGYCTSITFLKNYYFKICLKIICIISLKRNICENYYEETSLKHLQLFSWCTDMQIDMHTGYQHKGTNNFL